MLKHAYLSLWKYRMHDFAWSGLSLAITRRLCRLYKHPRFVSPKKE